MGIEDDQVAEGLDVEDETRLARWVHGFEALIKELGDELAECSQPGAVVAKIRAQELWQREHILAVRNSGQHVLRSVSTAIFRESVHVGVKEQLAMAHASMIRANLERGAEHSHDSGDAAALERALTQRLERRPVCA